MSALLRQTTWIWPLAFAAVLGLVAWQSLSTLKQTMRQQVGSNLQTTLDATTASLEIWANENRKSIQTEANDNEVRTLVTKLHGIARRLDDPSTELRNVPEHAELQRVMAPIMELRSYIGWGVLDESGLFLATFTSASAGHRPKMGHVVIGDSFETRETVFTAPMVWNPGVEGGMVAKMIIVAAPVIADDGRMVGLLSFALDPEAEFRKIMEVGRLGESGETYTFDETGVMVSPSRFDDDLRELGLLPEDPEIGSALYVQIRAPGGDLTQGFTTDVPVKARPFTLSAAQATDRQSGVNVDGYSDYRGVQVAGAWTWLPELGLGMATEIDMAEAFAGLVIVRRSFLMLIGLLTVGALGMMVYSIVVMRQRSALDEAEQLGRYKIERKIGKGGMGTVYLASHALLRRPTAIKVVKLETAGEEGIKRFEREVQVTSSLTHPNTIEIYDYGTTPDGTFYYAMELLRGITLGQLVELDGPQPENRVVSIMLQAAASLAEAHVNELIHRDLKPSNIMICDRGGVLDFVKVLDFGLVRPEKQSEDVALTSEASLTGTPLYMSPESVESPEKMTVRSDVYQLGAIAYYLLAGRHVFPGDSLVDVLAKHLNDLPESIETLRGESVSPALEAIVMRCLAKDPEDRPRDAGELVELLEELEIDGRWDQRAARGWWALWRDKYPDSEGADGPSIGGSMPSNYQIDLKGRLG